MPIAFQCQTCGWKKGFPDGSSMRTCPECGSHNVSIFKILEDIPEPLNFCKQHQEKLE